MDINSKKRNYLLILMCFIVYTSTYFLKYSYNANIVNIESKFNVLHSETGLVSTLFFITYGIGQFVNAIFVKKYNLKIVVPSAIFISSVLNILVMSAPTDCFYLVKIYWFINGAVLSCLWPCTIRMLTENISEEYKDKSIVIIGLATATGTILTYVISSILTKVNRFNFIFLFASVVGFIFCVVWLILYGKVALPRDLAKVEEKQVVHKDKENISFFVYVSITALLCAVSCFVRDGISNWCPIILVECFDFDKSSSVLLTVIMPISQFLGTIGAVQMKKLVKSHMLLSTLMVISSMLVLSIGLIFDFGEKYSLISGMFVTIFCMTVICAIGTTIIPMVWSKFRNSGFYAGIFNGFCYFGSAFATFGLGLIADNGTWSSVFKVLILALLVTTLISGGYLLIAKIFKLGYDESGAVRVKK